jgi:hypothetical protein
MARGDHIYVQRLGGVYSHHGIDCGDGTVIHLTAFRRGAPGVERIALDQFAEGGEVKVRDYDAFLRAASEPERAVRNASLAFGKALDSARGIAAEHPDTSASTPGSTTASTSRPGAAPASAAAPRSTRSGGWRWDRPAIGSTRPARR